MTDEHRNGFGFPVPDPSEDRPLLIEMYESESFLPGWALWAGVVALVALAAYARVM